MALTAAQYRTMRDLFRGALSVDSANPTDTDVLTFFKQFLADAVGATALSNASQFLAGEIARGILSGNFSNPTDANIVDFWTALAADANAGSAMSSTSAQYITMKKALVGAFSRDFFNPTQADVFGYFNFFGLSGYLGQVATRASMNLNVFGTATTFMNRTGHIARDTITSVQVAWANWYGANGGGYTAPAGALTVTASIEYPAGTFTQLKWSGSASVVVASGGNPLSDATAIPGGIPNGATFWVRSFLAPSANICYADGVNKSAAIGDLCMNAGSSDMTMGGTITNNSSAVIFPIAIVGQTTKRSCLLLGHSMVDGLFDQSADATGDNGELQRPLNPTYASIRLGCTGETLATFLTKATQRVALGTYCTDIVIDYSANDLNGGATAATILANYTSLATLFPGKRLSLGTAAPVAVTSSDSYATLGNQTVGASEAQRQLLNTAIRAGLAGYNTIELADFVEQARSGKWKVDGTANKYTSDGTHQTTFANQQITITLP